ncbi:6-hydroxymethylpterin diphosphokinase MptE-like protein [Methanofervidicoccus abyssi]|uniref:6-hydroxymethyl-7,8-dihydropterin pyrophosphokinase n=1 Tax=Methanofervidicoccus abyssi TaxID=2082189 RepID=A0A401HPY2_9EURY|nr:6-hydroxymethylpterin diphosphokinase MptE-like protein [Methanofervidicoccus abyssi]GBF36337.1 2-amino-4-hydroxy-6-hydroxymethyldihydropteridine diphosphokinase [Methanofervidicoccus abyssi]
MDLRDWAPMYSKIIEDFKFNRERDLKSGLLLKDLIDKLNNNIPEKRLREVIEGKIVYVVGAGPSIKRHVKILKILKERDVIISADGATKALLEEDILPDIVVSDLDGDMESILESNRRGSIVIVHAHGDNIDKIKKYLPKLKNIVGSYQVPLQIPGLINYGGFTDGDRCCFLAEYCGAKRIVLCGMDFGEYITKYSRPNLRREVERGDDIKIKKLRYAKELIEYLKKHGRCIILSIEEWIRCQR